MTRLHYRPDPADAARLRKLCGGTLLTGPEHMRIAMRQYLDRQERPARVAKIKEVER